MLAIIEFTFHHITYEATAHRVINPASEAMNSVVRVISVKVGIKYAYLNMQSATLESHFEL